MKWGVRRYQPYPRNYHGKGKYLGPNKAGNMPDEMITGWMKESEKNRNSSSTRYNVLRNPAVKSYNKHSKSGKDLSKYSRKEAERSSKLSDKINKQLMRKYKGVPDIVTDSKRFGEYYSEGIKKMQEVSKNDKKLSKYATKRLEASRLYEKETREFMEDLLGELGKEKTPWKELVKVNTKTGKVETQTLVDRAVAEMLRDKGGLVV